MGNHISVSLVLQYVSTVLTVCFVLRCVGLTWKIVLNDALCGLWSGLIVNVTSHIYIQSQKAHFEALSIIKQSN